MTHHTNDTFGNEASRPQDAVPIDEAGRLPAGAHTEPHAETTGDLKELADLTSATPATTPDETKPVGARGERRTRRKADRTSASQPQESVAAQTGDALHDLEAQGFTADEARRLVDISDRLDESTEVRESEATLRRLRFTRWLLDHGRLDEWSA